MDKLGDEYLIFHRFEGHHLERYFQRNEPTRGEQKIREETARRGRSSVLLTMLDMLTLYSGTQYVGSEDAGIGCPVPVSSTALITAKPIGLTSIVGQESLVLYPLA